jgi:hypothetical protein
MPEIDIDIFQWAALGLLVLVVILLLLLYSALGQVRRALEDRSERAQASAHLEHAAQPAIQAAEPAEASPAEIHTHPLEAARSDTPAQAEAAQAQPAHAQPVQGTAAQGQPVQAQAAQEQPDQARAEPQEQPFERDGRWWFRRGDELLVYDERAGQWVPAPDEAAPVAQTAAPAAAAGAATEPLEPTHEAAGSFWKCPSCGAVNGSTATACRMCFTARP